MGRAGAPRQHRGRSARRRGRREVRPGRAPGIFSGGRPARYGFTGTTGDYANDANRQTLVCIMLEEVEAIENLPELVTVPGVDVYFIGSGDLSQSMGYTGQQTHPEVQKMMERGVQIITDAGRIAGCSCPDNLIPKFWAWGYSISIAMWAACSRAASPTCRPCARPPPLRGSDVGEVPMQRVVIYLQRRPDLPQPLFFDWWLGQHRALAEQLPGLRQYIISLAATDEQERPFDGMAELWFDDLAAAEAAFASPAGQAARADAEAHAARRERLNLTEHTIIDHPAPPPASLPPASNAAPI